MADPDIPTWEDIRELINRADEVCRESEYLRARAERARQRAAVWPDLRHERNEAERRSRYGGRGRAATSTQGGGDASSV